MKITTFIICYLLILSGCYTKLTETHKPVDYTEQVTTDYFLPTSDNFSKYDDLKPLFNCWRHSHEESTDSQNVYRPDSWKFRPARYRDNIIFYRNGDYEFSKLLPTDGVSMEKGIWRLYKGDPKVIAVVGNSIGNFSRFRILILNDSLLSINYFKKKDVVNIHD